jgi:hypothetical protein
VVICVAPAERSPPINRPAAKDAPWQKQQQQQQQQQHTEFATSVWRICQGLAELVTLKT